MSDAWTPDSPIREECWTEYRKLYATIWDHLVYLRTSLFLVRELARFPLHRLAAHDDQWFFTVVRRSLLEGVVLTITKLTTDQGSDVLTLLRFRNLVLSMLRPEFQAKFRADLKSTNLDKATEELATRARDLRDNRLAHLLLPQLTNASTIQLTIADLDRLVNETERLFQPLLFGGEARFLPPAYDPEVRKANSPWTTDFEKVLNAFARESHVLRYPEQHADLWPRLRAEWSAEDVNQFNYWRARAGLPEA